MSTENDRAVLNRILNPLLPTEVGAGDNKIEDDEPIDHPGFSESHNLEKEGVILAEKGDVNGSIEAFTKAIEVCDVNPSLYNNRGQALRLQGKPAEALQDLDRAICLSKGKGRSACQAFVQRAMVKRLQGKDDDGREDFQHASDLGSSFAKMQLVAMNPYAAMCNKMLAEVMQNLKDGNP